MLFRVSVYPVGQDEAMEVLMASGLPCTLSTLESIVEGDWDEVVEVLGEVYRRIRAQHGEAHLTIRALEHPATAAASDVLTTRPTGLLVDAENPLSPAQRPASDLRRGSGSTS